ncbi:LemA family protein [Mesomycoplasma ovipneumoniae]|uniref:LemA family protein n=1 Tax=Mesomycoplasma ovipneumoniae TaxID=29562 RepID=UPI0028A803F1|nr:LemA family protein [Mesomycoplasma ovipneumoniae]MDW2834316.1 LemA family protein [Mesomycoplasma ovipneumoniae]WNM13236.1 LemA family protein [Mesomycoplasma ovipneumoniae]
MSNLYNPKNAGNIEGFEPRIDNDSKKPVVSTAAKVAFWTLGTLFLFIAPIYYISQKNNFMRQQNSINESAGTIEVQLEQRSATLLKLADQVRSYREYEKSILSDITRLRSLKSNIENAQEIENLNNSLFGRLIAVSENYPELQASKIYQELIEQTSYLERELAAARRLYNSNVNSFNTEIFVFPSSIVASSMNLTTYPMFSTSNQNRQDVSFKDF